MSATTTSSSPTPTSPSTCAAAAPRFSLAAPVLGSRRRAAEPRVAAAAEHQPRCVPPHQVHVLESPRHKMRQLEELVREMEVRHLRRSPPATSSSFPPPRHRHLHLLLGHLHPRHLRPITGARARRGARAEPVAAADGAVPHGRLRQPQARRRPGGALGRKGARPGRCGPPRAADSPERGGRAVCTPVAVYHPRWRASSPRWTGWAGCASWRCTAT